MNVISFIITAIFIVCFCVPSLILGVIFIYYVLKDCKPLLFILLTFPALPLILLVLFFKDCFENIHRKNLHK